METISEVVYWAVLLYTPIYWFIGLIVLGGCFIAGTIWSTLTGSFRPQTPVVVQKIVALASSLIAKAEWNLVLELWPWTLPVIRTFRNIFVR
jgi:hypothetical protein